MPGGAGTAIKAARGLEKAVEGARTAEKAGDSFDSARRGAFESAGMNGPSKVIFSKVDEKTGTVVEFKEEGGAKIGYDGPHASGPHHDTQHISWQSAGKRGDGCTAWKTSHIPENAIPQGRIGALNEHER
ncbi:polymorphic toxin type 47 domain-containing protein [Stenotrophomonas sp. WHRI 8082]|uniref:polymorphic toxin type 47 domain-containing protein n=1 Tax=Stenotrophomonas sp. WHRI 8082 TaxID=3162571 RepID=UPI0032EFE8D1